MKGISLGESQKRTLVIGQLEIKISNAICFQNAMVSSIVGQEFHNFGLNFLWVFHGAPERKSHSFCHVAKMGLMVYN